MSDDHKKPDLMNIHAESSWARTKLVVSHPSSFVDYGVGSHKRMLRRYAKQLWQKGLLPAGILSPDLESKLRTIEPEEIGCVPASAILRDGVILPRVLFVDDKFVTEHIEPFWKALVRPEDLVDIVPSPDRLPVRFVKELDKFTGDFDVDPRVSSDSQKRGADCVLVRWA